MINLILVEGHKLVRSGIRKILSHIQGIQVLAETSSGIKAVQLIQDLQPHILILDVKLPDISSLEVIQQALEICQELKILILTSCTNDALAFRLLKAGVQGYLSKNVSKEEFLHAIQSVYLGQRFLSAKIASQLALSPFHSHDKEKELLHHLSDREREVMKMIVQGETIQEMVQKSNLSNKTIHTYRSRIFNKLHVKGDIALTLLAIRNGVISIEEPSS